MAGADAPAPAADTGWRSRVARGHRLLAVCVLGFASGLPLALTGQAMQAWLTADGLDIATIGFLSLVGIPYTFKFLWAPLMDRFEPPWLGRRRGWLVVTQLALAGALFWMAFVPPASALGAFAMLAGLVAFLSASQDIVVDAWRTDALRAEERGMGSSLNVLGYRLAMIVSGGLAFIWVDAQQGGGWSWPQVYRVMAVFMVVAAVFSALALPRLPRAAAPTSVARHDLAGFLAVVAAVAVGVVVTSQVFSPFARRFVAPFFEGGTMTAALAQRWADVLALVLGLALTVPLVGWAARRARFETFLGSLDSYFSQKGAFAFLVCIVLYKLPDAFAGALLTPFLLQAMHYTTAEVGVVNKVIGLWLTIGGALVAGFVMLRIGLWWSLFVFGVLQAASNLGFWWLAVSGQGALPSIVLPAFDWGFVSLREATRVDGGLLLAVALENITGGMGTAAFVAFLMALCNRRFSATQYALLSAFASVGRVWVGPVAGVLAQSIGWPTFFVITTLAALPALGLLVWLKRPVDQIDRDDAAAVEPQAASRI